MKSECEPLVPGSSPSAPESQPPAAMIRAAMSIAMTGAIVSVAALVAMGLEMSLEGLRETLFLAISIVVLGLALEFSLRRGWGEPARVALLFFVAGATLTSLHLWPNPSEISFEGPGWLGLWLVVVPIVFALPRWAGAVGLGAAWASLLCRGALLGVTPDLRSLGLASISLTVCVVGLAMFNLTPAETEESSSGIQD